MIEGLREMNIIKREGNKRVRRIERINEEKRQSE